MRKVQYVPDSSWLEGRSRCENCDAVMWLASIEPDDKSDYDRRTFECPRCQHQMVEIVKYR
jgi:hypothetical protein